MTEIRRKSGEYHISHGEMLKEGDVLNCGTSPRQGRSELKNVHGIQSLRP